MKYPPGPGPHRALVRDLGTIYVFFIFIYDEEKIILAGGEINCLSETFFVSRYCPQHIRVWCKRRRGSIQGNDVSSTIYPHLRECWSPQITAVIVCLVKNARKPRTFVTQVKKFSGSVRLRK